MFIYPNLEQMMAETMHLKFEIFFFISLHIQLSHLHSGIGIINPISNPYLSLNFFTRYIKTLMKPFANVLCDSFSNCCCCLLYLANIYANNMQLHTFTTVHAHPHTHRIYIHRSRQTEAFKTNVAAPKSAR